MGIYEGWKTGKAVKEVCRSSCEGRETGVSLQNHSWPRLVMYLRSYNVRILQSVAKFRCSVVGGEEGMGGGGFVFLS